MAYGEKGPDLYDRDGDKASVGTSEGYWAAAEDFITTGDRRFGREGFPRGWPEVYEKNKALRRLIGKKGLKGIMCKTVDMPSKNDVRRELPEECKHLRPGQSYTNAELLHARRGWAIVKGFVIYELLDGVEGETFVAHKHWWNAQEDGAWVDYTPAEPGSNTASVQVRLLCESADGEKQCTLLDYAADIQAKQLLKERQEAASAVAKAEAEEQKKKAASTAFDAFGGMEHSQGPTVSADTALMNAPEAERLVEELQMFKIEKVGSRKWMAQHDVLQRLSLQAHHNVRSYSEEFVKEAFISFDKINEIVHELLVIELWKEKVYPLLGDEQYTGQVASIDIYICLYHENVLVNLIELLLFHRDALQAMSDDTTLELIDYCHRQLLYLNSGMAKDDVDASKDPTTADEWMKKSKKEEQETKVKELRFGAAISALSVLRYLTDYSESVALGVMARMLDTHDTIVQLVPLLEERPWVRRRKKGTGKDRKNTMEVWDNGVWSPLPPEERLKVAKADAQVWLALNNLIVDPRCRAKYNYDDYRREQVGRLQRHFNEVLFDQLPVLKDLQRCVSEVQFMVTPSSADVTQGRLVLEQVPEIRAAMLNRGDWQHIADKQMASCFADSEENLKRLKKKMEKMVEHFDFMSMLDGGGMEDHITLDMSGSMPNLD